MKNPLLKQIFMILNLYQFKQASVNKFFVYKIGTLPWYRYQYLIFWLKTKISPEIFAFEKMRFLPGSGSVFNIWIRIQQVKLSYKKSTFKAIFHDFHLIFKSDR